MTEGEALELRRAAWRITRLCCALDNWTLFGDRQEDLIREARESAATLREMAGSPQKCNGNGG